MEAHNVIHKEEALLHIKTEKLEAATMDVHDESVQIKYKGFACNNLVVINERGAHRNSLVDRKIPIKQNCSGRIRDSDEGD